MKVYVIVLALASICQLHVDSKPIHQTELFKEAMKKYMELLRTGDERLGIPQLDPFVYDEKNEKFFKGNPLFDDKNITAYVVRGLSNVVIQDLSVDGDEKSFVETIDILWPNITADMKYTQKPDSIFGDLDPQDVESRTLLKDFNIATTVKFKKDVETKALTIESVEGTKILFDKIELHGVINKVLPISAVIPGEGSEMTEIFQRLFTPMFEKFMMEHGNKMIKTIDQEKLRAHLGLENAVYFL